MVSVNAAELHVYQCHACVSVCWDLVLLEQHIQCACHVQLLTGLTSCHLLWAGRAGPHTSCASYIEHPLLARLGVNAVPPSRCAPAGCPVHCISLPSLVAEGGDDLSGACVALVSESLRWVPNLLLSTSLRCRNVHCAVLRPACMPLNLPRPSVHSVAA